MKTIPKVSKPSAQARDIEGLTWTVSRLTARAAPEVLSRLVADVGELIAEMLAIPDRELPPEIEAAITAMSGRVLPLSIMKSILFSSVFGRIRGIDLRWYVQRIVVGFVSVNGVDIETMEELDETGIGAEGVAMLLWHAIGENFAFIFAGLATSAGGEESARTENRVSGTSNLKGETVKAGQRAQTLIQ